MKKRTPIFRPIVLTFLMAISFGIGVGFLGAGIYEGWQEYKREVLEIRKETNWTNHTFAFLSNGTPIVSDRRTSFNQTVDVLTHLDGSSLSEDEERNRLYQAGIAYYPSNHLRRLPFSGAPFEELLSRRDRRLVIHDPENNSITWQWEFDSDSADSSLLVARHRSNDQALTYVSPDGFSVNRAAHGNGFASPEHSRTNGELLEFHSAGKLIGIDLAKKTVRTITDIDPVSDAWATFRLSEEAGWRFVVRNSTSFRIFSDRGERLAEFPVPASVFGTPPLYTLDDGTFIVTRYEGRTAEQLPGGNSRGERQLVASWLDETGKTTRTQKFQEVFTSKEFEPSSFVVATIDNFIEKAAAGLALPEPAVLCGGTFFIIPWITSSRRPPGSRNDVAKEIVGQMPYAIPVAVIAGILSAIACWRRQVRYQADWTKTWVVFVFLFGLPAWIAWRVHRRWPPLDLAGAPEAEFIGPEPNGLEIR